MGQTIEINSARRIGDVLVIDTDRSLTGQDGESYLRGVTSEATTFPAGLATRLFEADPSVEGVYVLSNVVSVRRRGGWDDPSATTSTDAVARFFRFYED